MSDIEFVDGLMVKAPHERAPDFVKCSISIKRKDLGNWLRGKSEDWINLDVKVAKSGKWYASVSTYKPKEEQKPGASVPAAEYAADPNDDLSDIPF